MRRVQEAALALFEKRGFDVVSIEEIAEAAGVGPATVYRNFGTKERVVLWDEYDPMLLEAIARELETRAPVEAVERAVASSLSAVYRDDLARILRRARLIRATPALARTAESDQRELRKALASVLLDARAARNDLEARVFAGALVAALEAGVDRWLDGDAKEPLSRSFARAFACLQRLGGVTLRGRKRSE
jgi:AcrR family transcriptional regulator